MKIKTLIYIIFFLFVTIVSILVINKHYSNLKDNNLTIYSKFICVDCNTEHKENGYFCTTCGSDNIIANNNYINCEECNNKVKGDYCTYCGNDLSNKVQLKDIKSDIKDVRTNIVTIHITTVICCISVILFVVFCLIGWLEMGKPVEIYDM